MPARPLRAGLVVVVPTPDPVSPANRTGEYRSGPVYYCDPSANRAPINSSTSRVISA